jgi:transposase
MNAPARPGAPLMRPRIDLAQVYLCRRPVDFRKGMRALAVLVEQELGCDPCAETVYVFTNRRRTAVKCLAWERNGFCLWHKHLEAERFKWPLHREETVVRLTGQELHWLLDGLDRRHLRPHKALSYKHIL